MTKLPSFQGHEDGSTYINQSTWYTTFIRGKIKHDYLKRHRKCIIQNSTSIHDILIKNPYQTGYRGNISQHNKSHLWQSHSQHNIQWWKAESLPAKIWNKKEFQLSPLLFNIVLEILDTEIQQEKEIKGIQIGKKDVKLLADDKILYIENPKNSTQKQVELTDWCSKVTEYKINTQKSVTFLYTNNEISERECNNEKTIPFKIIPPTHTKKKILKNKPDQRGKRLICWEL